MVNEVSEMIHQEPLISVVVPVYNKIRYIEKLLGMIADQTLQNFECILVDDGSTDGSEKICEDFSKTDSRFKTLHILNNGVSHARNIGLDVSKGKYISFIDADDEIAPNYLANLYQCIERQETDMVISWFSSLMPSGEIKKNALPLKPQKYAIQDVLPIFSRLQKESGVFGWCWGKIIKRDLINSTRFNEELKLAEDFDFYLNLYSRVKTFYFDGKQYYYYRQKADNSSVMINDEDIDYLAQLKINLHYKQFLKEMEAWYGENQKIVEKSLSNYAYFTLYYCQIKKFDSCFKQIYDICRNESIPLYSQGTYQNIVLKMLKNNNRVAAKLIIKARRFIRRIKNGI